MSNSTFPLTSKAAQLVYMKGTGKASCFFFPSNPAAIVRAHRMPELVAYLSKDDRASIEVLLSDAFKAEVYKHGMSLFEVIRAAKSHLDAEKADYIAALAAAKKAAKEAAAQALEAKKLAKKKSMFGEVA